LISVKDKLSKLQSYPKELGLDLRRAEHRFRWFLASILFGRRISVEIAKRTYRRFEAEGLLSPEAILQAGWDKLVEVLDSGGYVRYDFSTATRLLEIMKYLKEKYGSLEDLHSQAEDNKDLEKRLLEFKGIGPVTVNIFLRELRGIWWKANPQLSSIAKTAAEKLGLSETIALSMEPLLIKLSLEFCRRKRCLNCPVRESCR